VADCYGGQLGHGAARQMCLAHLLRDAKYAIEDGDTVFAPGFRQLLLRATAIGKRRDTLRNTTLAQYLADLERRLSRLLSGSAPTNKSARRLFRAMHRDRDDLFRFITLRDVPYTNNACERGRRPSVIFRKVTNGFRAEWGSQVYAAAASVMATGLCMALPRFRPFATHSPAYRLCNQDDRRAGGEQLRSMPRVHPPLSRSSPAQGFHRIRHYGLFANGSPAESLARVRELLAVSAHRAETDTSAQDNAQEPDLLALPCPCCGGRMIIIEIFEPGFQPRYRPSDSRVPIRLDTS
jgi:transposase